MNRSTYYNSSTILIGDLQSQTYSLHFLYIVHQRTILCKTWLVLNFALLNSVGHRQGTAHTQTTAEYGNAKINVSKQLRVPDNAAAHGGAKTSSVRRKNNWRLLQSENRRTLHATRVGKNCLTQIDASLTQQPKCRVKSSYNLVRGAECGHTESLQLALCLSHLKTPQINAMTITVTRKKGQSRNRSALSRVTKNWRDSHSARLGDRSTKANIPEMRESIGENADFWCTHALHSSIGARMPVNMGGSSWYFQEQRTFLTAAPGSIPTDAIFCRFFGVSGLRYIISLYVPATHDSVFWIAYPSLRSQSQRVHRPFSRLVSSLVV